MPYSLPENMKSKALERQFQFELQMIHYKLKLNVELTQVYF